MTDNNRDKMLEAWKLADATAKAAVLKERELRAQVIEAFSEITEEMHSGTESIDIGWGHDLKIEHKLDYKIDNSNDYEAFENVLDEIEKNVEGGSILTERLYKRELSLYVSEYKKLPEQAKKLIEKVITIKPAAKSVKIHKRGK